MASLPSIAFTTIPKLEPELKKIPSPPPSLPLQKGPGFSNVREPIKNYLDGSSEPTIKPLELREALFRREAWPKVESWYYVPLLQHCIDNNSVPETEIIHAHMIKTGIHEDNFLMTCLFNVYAKCGCMENARKVFDRLHRRNVVAWTTLMTGYVQESRPKVAIQVFVEMLESGSFGSSFTLGIALNACSSLDSIELVKQLHGYMIKYQIDRDTSIGNALCSLYSKFGSLESTLKAFQKIEEKDVISWTAVISACGQNRDAKNGLRYFIEMLLEYIEPNEYTLTSVMSLCCFMPCFNMGKQVHSLCTKLGYESNLRITNSVMYLYLKSGYIEEAGFLFNRMESVSLVTYNAMISGHEQAMHVAKDGLSSHQCGTEALSIYSKLNESGMKPDLFTLSSILTVCGRLMALHQGEQFHAHAIKSGFLSDVIVGTSLVNMYNKCGSIRQASKAFLEMPTRTMISWTAMIASFAQHGQSQRALQLFEDMRVAGIRPNQVTFVSVLSACGHAGMVDEALEYFKMMQKDYRIKPVMDHYACLVDMFVRLGRLDEALNIVSNMEIEPSESIWLLLIAGCRNNGFEELGFFAAEHLLNLKPKDAETYMKLLNMYIYAERWENVSKVRKLMKEVKDGMLKDWSWISIRDKVFSFTTNDHSHPPNAELDTYFEALLEKAKSFGYEPEERLEVVDDENDEEAGEEDNDTFSSAIRHSEKLAVAFGMLNMHSDVPIRVIKCTSMCKDCHNFIKVVSLMSSRRIIIRDRKRLHIFDKGHCSCADSNTYIWCNLC